MCFDSVGAGGIGNGNCGFGGVLLVLVLVVGVLEMKVEVGNVLAIKRLFCAKFLHMCYYIC